MPQDTIWIYHGDPVTGHLDLSDNGYSHVKQYDRIHWIIDPTKSNVASIDKIHKKQGSPNLFVLGPSRKGSEWTGKVMFAPTQDYEYYITWTEKNNPGSHTYDPKIAVKPGVHIMLLVATGVVAVALLLLGIRRFLFARK